MDTRILNANCRFRDCMPLTLTCPSCSSTFNCPTVSSSICRSISEKSKPAQGEEPSYGIWSKLRCLKCPEEGDLGRFTPGMVANQVLYSTFKNFAYLYRCILGEITDHANSLADIIETHNWLHVPCTLQ